MANRARDLDAVAINRCAATGVTRASVTSAGVTREWRRLVGVHTTCPGTGRGGSRVCRRGQRANASAMELPGKTKTALDETRILVLASQILIGFQFRSVFADGYEQLPAHASFLNG